MNPINAFTPFVDNFHWVESNGPDNQIPVPNTLTSIVTKLMYLEFQNYINNKFVTLDLTDRTDLTVVFKPNDPKVVKYYIKDNDLFLSLIDDYDFTFDIEYIYDFMNTRSITVYVNVECNNPNYQLTNLAFTTNHKFKLFINGKEVMQ